MSLEIYSLKNIGDADKEMISLKVLESCNLLGYAIVDNTFTSKGEQSNIHRHIFLFPSFQVEKGDYVQLYTADGKRESVKNKAKTTTHKFYWNSDTAIWNDTGDTAHLISYKRLDKKSV